MTTTITPALIDGLTADTGAIPNGPNLPTAHATPKHEIDRNREIRVIQPAAGNWRCDSCGHSGYGGSNLLHHAAVTNHHLYTALD